MIVIEEKNEFTQKHGVENIKTGKKEIKKIDQIDFALNLTEITTLIYELHEKRATAESLVSNISAADIKKIPTELLKSLMTDKPNDAAWKIFEIRKYGRDIEGGIVIAIDLLSAYKFKEAMLEKIPNIIPQLEKKLAEETGRLPSSIQSKNTSQQYNKRLSTLKEKLEQFSTDFTQDKSIDFLKKYL